MTEPHHTAAHWATRRRDLDDFVVKRVTEHVEQVELLSTDSTGFMRSKADLGREIRVGERLQLETIGFSQITGLRDDDGWLFRLTNQDLADDARRFTEDMHRRKIEELERHRKKYATQEAALPEWLRARIRRFREAAGEKFLREGWGYELMICRLADLMDRGLDDDADKLASDEGATGNQWSCAKALAGGRIKHGDDFAVQVPAGLSPITGSADYSAR